MEVVEAELNSVRRVSDLMQSPLFPNRLLLRVRWHFEDCSGHVNVLGSGKKKGRWWRIPYSTEQYLPPSLPMLVPGVVSPHLPLVPPLLHRHPHVVGEEAVEDADDTSLRRRKAQFSIFRSLVDFPTNLWTFQNCVRHHVGVFIYSLILGVYAKQQTVHPEKEKEDNRGLHPLPEKWK